VWEDRERENTCPLANLEFSVTHIPARGNHVMLIDVSQRPLLAEVIQVVHHLRAAGPHVDAMHHVDVILREIPVLR